MELINHPAYPACKHWGPGSFKNVEYAYLICQPPEDKYLYPPMYSGPKYPRLVIYWETKKASETISIASGNYEIYYLMACGFPKNKISVLP